LRLLTEYAAIPKMPVMDSIAPSTPNTPSDDAAMRGPKKVRSSSWFQVPMIKGRPASTSRSLLLAAAIRSKLRDVDAGLPFIIGTWNQELDLTFFGPRMAASSLGVLGVLGAMLSITGIFGMAAYSVSKRKRELGIRVALGAQRMEVVQAALGRAFKLLAIGSAAGLLLGILASRVLALIV